MNATHTTGGGGCAALALAHAFSESADQVAAGRIPRGALADAQHGVPDTSRREQRTMTAPMPIPEMRGEEVIANRGQTVARGAIQGSW